MYAARPGWLAGWFDRLLPTSAFPRADHRRRIRASFVMALAAMQFAASLLFALTELLVQHWAVAGLMLVGAMLPVWPAYRLRRDGNVDRWAQVFVANMFVLLGAILLASGGRSLGIVMALPAMLLVSALVLSGRQLVGWGLLVVGLLLLAQFLRTLPGPWPIEIDPQWARHSVDRVPVVLAICLLLMASLLRLLLDRVFSELAQARASETEAIQRAQFDQQRFADFADLAADWFWETDARDLLVYVSPGITTHTGLRPDQVVGQSALQVARQQRLDSAELRRVEQCMANREPFQAERMAWRNADGEVAMFSNIGRPRFDPQGAFLGYRGAVTNITENWLLTRELKRQARTDPLTGLLNRRAFAQALERAVEGARAGAGWWLLQLDLDQFKAVNDRAGHAVGDRVLMRVAALLHDCGLPTEGLARIGGDEFCALLEARDRQAVLACAERIVAAFQQLQREFDCPLGASIGIVAVQQDNTQPPLLAVDEACYRAKRAGRGQVVLAE